MYSNGNNMDKKLDAAGESILGTVRKNLSLMPKNADVFTYDPYTEWYFPSVNSNIDKKESNITLKNLLNKINNLKNSSKK